MQLANNRILFLSVFFLGTACVDGKFNVDQFLPQEENLDQDGDGFTGEQGDCNDQDASIHPDAQELCDSIDNNCNTHIDEESFVWTWSGSSAEWRVGEGVASLEVSIDDEGWDDDDYMADGMLDEHQVYTFDRDGTIIKKEIDRGADGSIDISIGYLYNALGLLSVENWDQGIDGSIERRISYTYDSLGQLLRIEKDNNADGLIESRESFEYSEAGLIEHSIDRDGDGVLEERELRVYEAGRLVELMSYDGGTLDAREVYSYTQEGVLLLKDVDSAADGDDILDTRFTYSVGESDGTRLVEVDQDMDGVIDELHFEYYDEEGRLLKEGKDFDADEEVEQVLNLSFGIRGLEQMSNVDTQSEDEEVVSIETLDEHRFMQTTIVDTRFFEAYIEKELSFSCFLPEEEPKEGT